MTSAKKEEQKKITLEALQLRRKLLQEHYKQALVTSSTTNTSSYQGSCGDSSDEYDSEDEHDDKKKDLEYHPKQQQDRKKKKRKGLVEKNDMQITATMIEDESLLEDESSTIELLEENSDSIKTTEDSKEENQKNKAVQQLKKKIRILKNGVEEKILTRTEFGELSFEEKVEVLAKYKEVHGHCNVSRHTSKHTSLAWWVYRLRHTRQGGKNGYKDFELTPELTPANIAKLDQLGFQWKTKTFEEHLHDLKEYKAKHGDCNVPFRYKENPKLAESFVVIRKAYKYFVAGKKSPSYNLTPSMVEQLEQLGFILKKRSSADEYILDLQMFKDEHGHCNVSRRYIDNKQLGAWVGHIRTSYKSIQAGKKPHHRLTPSMINQLNDMGFSWQRKR